MEHLHLMSAHTIDWRINRLAPIKVLLTSCALLLVAGCTTMYPSNSALDQVGKDNNYSYKNVVEESEAGSEVMILLAISGGGNPCSVILLRGAPGTGGDTGNYQRQGLLSV